MNFFVDAFKVIANNMFNDYNDNWDYGRFGRKQRVKRGIRNKIQRLLNRRGYYHVFTIHHLIIQNLWINKFEYLYNRLSLVDDRKLLLDVLSYRILGYKRVKLPLNTTDYWDKVKSLEELCNKSDFIDPHFMHFILYKMNLNKINLPIEFYFTPGGVLTDFILKQYEYNHKDIFIKAEKGDTVIDGGGCWGDTALFFANEVGDKGEVYSFEFIPNNISIFEKNISLNKNLLERIELVKHPMWNNSSTIMYFKDQGPGSKVSLEKFDDLDGDCLTLTIDDFVIQKGLGKIDFIKMDIEGAEWNALKGASETIKKFKPKLAVALYHSVEDFERIPMFIKNIVPEYEFYFSHCSINAEESILFAKVN
jgi:FkbM family methyltransferase